MRTYPLVANQASHVLVYLAPQLFTREEVSTTLHPEADDEPSTGVPTTDEHASESTPLVTRTEAEKTRTRALDIALNPILLSIVLGLLVGLVPFLKHNVVGDEGARSGFWQSIGLGLQWLGGTYAVVEVIGHGASMRASEST